MTYLKIDYLNNLIPVSMFDVCALDNLNREQITKLFPTRKNGAYYLDKFLNHLKINHNTSIQEYVEKFLKIEWPRCQKTNKLMGFRINGKGIFVSKYQQGGINKENCESFKKACEKISKDRVGKGNPMYGKTPWNKNNKEFAEFIRKTKTGVKYSDETRAKQSESAKKRKIHGHTGKKHSQESKEKMRKATIERWRRGDFEFRTSSIELKVKTFLEEIECQYKFQEQIGNFVADFYLADFNLIIECNGSFFHCEPDTKYANPKFEVQKRNVKKDKIKKDFYRQKNINLLELWESEIHSGEFKEKIKCTLKKLSQ